LAKLKVFIFVHGPTRLDRARTKQPQLNKETTTLGELPGGVYQFPGMSASHEKMSFATQVRMYFNQRARPPLGLLHNVLERLYHPARWSVPDDVFSLQNVVKSFVAMNLDASPGWPLMQRFSTNRDLVAKIGYVQLAVWVREHMEHLLRGGRCYPVRIFVKPEWHKVSKIKAGRLRCIWSVSLLDQLVDQLLFGPSLQAELSNYRRIPAKPGLSEFGNGMGEIFDEMEPEGEMHRFAETDKTAWDMTVPQWMWQVDCEARLRLCLNQPAEDSMFVKLWHIRYRQLACSDVVFSDGTLVRQVVPGIMRSGCKLTISANSRMQVALKVLYCQQFHGQYVDVRHRIFATGDDTIERIDPCPQGCGVCARGAFLTEYIDFLRGLGFHIKGEDVHELDTLIGANYVGRTFIRHRDASVVVFRPSYWEKNRFGLCHQKPELLAAALSSACSEYSFDDIHFPLLYAILVRVDATRRYVRSRRYWQTQIIGSEMAFRDLSELDGNPETNSLC